MVSASSNALSKPGYFDSYPAASIDFCEPNYTHTPYIAEVFNSVSSLSIVYLGIVGLVRTRKAQWCSDCKYERLIFYSLVSVGSLPSVPTMQKHRCHVL